MSTLVEQPVVLAVGAHPDDAERLCAGTLALLKRKGWRVVIACLSSSERQMEIALPDAAADRPDPPSGSAAVLQAEHHCLESTAFAIVYADELCRRATGLIRAVHPALVLTHGPTDATPDHEETSRTIRQACLAAPVEEYTTLGFCGGVEPTGRVPHLYYLDPIELIDILGRPVEASLVVDISAAIDVKVNVLAHGGAQSPRAEQCQDVERRIDEARAWGQRRGEQAGCAFGEGFRQHVGHAYPRDNLLREVLGPLVHVVNSQQ